MSNILETTTPDFLPEASFENIGNEVEFKGEPPIEELEKEPSIEGLTLEEKVTRLRAPYDEDKAISATHINERCRLQTEIDSRTEEIATLQDDIAAFEERGEAISEKANEELGKFSSRLRMKLGLRVKSYESLLSQQSEVSEKSRAALSRKDTLSQELRNLEDKKTQLEQLADYSEEIEPISAAEKEQLLDPEALSELSLEEYIALWRRLNPFYASHVTRQGVRDHRNIANHTRGLSEFQSGFTDMLKQGKSLHSAAELYYDLPESFTEDNVRHAMETTVKEKAEEIDKRLSAGEEPEAVAKSLVKMHDMCYSTATAEPWGDYHAIHFARNTCADETYGAEKGNEVFYVFPIDVIASQNRFRDESDQGGKGLITAPVVNERERNNLFVWAESGQIPLDSGIVFLPKSAPVSPETGSIYETFESIGPNGKTIREPILDENAVRSVTNALETLESEGFYASDTAFYQTISDSEKRHALLKRLETEFGISPEAAEASINMNNDILRYGVEKHIKNADFIKSAETDGFDLSSLDASEQARLAIRYALEKNQIGLKKAESPISAEEYWRGYFNARPDEAPKHIVFYDGDPSEAVDRFLEENGIATPIHRGVKSDTLPNVTGPGDTHITDGPWLGFESHNVDDPAEDEKLQAEKARFVEQAVPIATELVRARQQKLKIVQ